MPGGASFADERSLAPAVDSQPVRECRRVARSDSGGHAYRSASHALRTAAAPGLDLIAVSLLLIPVTPGVLMLTAAMGSGDDLLIRLSVAGDA